MHSKSVLVIMTGDIKFSFNFPLLFNSIRYCYIYYLLASLYLTIHLKMFVKATTLSRPQFTGPFFLQYFFNKDNIAQRYQFHPNPIFYENPNNYFKY